MDGALLAGQQAGAHLDAAGPKGKGGGELPAISDAAGGDDGTLTASTTWGTRAMVVSSPMWPPLSQPSAMTPSMP